jgi:hypothetical protein
VGIIVRYERRHGVRFSLQGIGHPQSRFRPTSARHVSPIIRGCATADLDIGDTAPLHIISV